MKSRYIQASFHGAYFYQSIPTLRLQSSQHSHFKIILQEKGFRYSSWDIRNLGHQTLTDSPTDTIPEDIF